MPSVCPGPVTAWCGRRRSAVRTGRAFPAGTRPQTASGSALCLFPNWKRVSLNSQVRGAQRLLQGRARPWGGPLCPVCFLPVGILSVRQVEARPCSERGSSRELGPKRSGSCVKRLLPSPSYCCRRPPDPSGAHPPQARAPAVRSQPSGGGSWCGEIAEQPLLKSQQTAQPRMFHRPQRKLHQEKIFNVRNHLKSFSFNKKPVCASFHPQVSFLHFVGQKSETGRDFCGRTGEGSMVGQGWKRQITRRPGPSSAGTSP